MTTRPPSDEPKVEYVTEAELRAMFNQQRLSERASTGELVRRILHYDTHLTRNQRERLNRALTDDSRRLPECSRSQMVLYTTRSGEPMALAHQYRRPDGTLGASGRPDPKVVFSGGKAIKARK